MERSVRISLLVMLLIIAGAVISFIMLTGWEGEEKVTIEENKVAIIDLQGALLTGEESSFGTSTGELQRALENAGRNHDIKAVVLRVDSPGGTATASYEMYSMVKRFEKPLIAFIRGAGASGSYLTALGAEKVVAHPFSEVGSVGVYIQLEKPVPVKPENATEIEIISSGKFKTLWEDGVLDENEREYLDLKVNELENTFREIVYEEAPIEKQPGEDFSEDMQNPYHVFKEGGWFDGRKALELGLIDNPGDQEDSIELACESAGIEREETEVIEIEIPEPDTYAKMFYETSVHRENGEPIVYLR